MGKHPIVDFFNKKQNLSALFICSFGVYLNIISFKIVNALGLPLYLDTIGTIIVASMGGYLPGVAVGFLTNMIKGLSDQAAIYYGVLNVIIAVSATLIASQNFKKYWHKILVSILTFSFIGGGVGTLIPWYMDEITFDSEALSLILYKKGFLNSFASHLFASLLMDLPDKIITVFIAELILHFVPKKFYRYSSFSMWLQQPFFKDDFKARDESKVRVISIRMKTLLALIFAFSIVALAGTNISLYIYHKSIMSDHKRLAIGTASLAAKIIDGDKVDEYISADGSIEGYNETNKLLTDILTSSPEISFLHVYKVYFYGFQVVFDVETEHSTPSKPGTLLPFDKGFIPFIPKLLSGLEIEPQITNDENGYLLTAVKPIFNSEGKCVCYAIADVNIKKLQADERSFLVEVIAVFLGFFLLMCTFSIWLSDYNIIYPIKSITDHVDNFEHAGSLNNIDECVQALKDVNIKTGDEVEKLFNSICRMTINQTEQTRSIRNLLNATAKMQDGLIMVMADFVENRDSDTGAHVQKTAAYVNIIVEGLNRKNYYPEIITPKFMSDVVRSAPLHDVGKIKIPDRILNKPGKFTDEEYEIMKTHTTAGKQIMDSVISTVEGENYLMEARNMAAYHHERWDGKGYPENLSGEDIPLSARIMAVADVFDALSSPRVYKPAYSLEKSLEIIQEGSGSHFDPKCVEVFLESIDEIKGVLKKFNSNI